MGFKGLIDLCSTDFETLKSQFVRRVDGTTLEKVWISEGLRWSRDRATLIVVYSLWVEMISTFFFPSFIGTEKDRSTFLTKKLNFYC